MKRIFKPGDRVQVRGGSQVMIVQKYAREYSRWTGWHESSFTVECTWLDTDGYKRRNFHQNNLIKATRNYQRSNTGKRQSIQK